ncbi:MAG: hypothetical protein A2Y90_00820 [Chloroflexi bacterium RBG_13_52_12]|nr:MAG: hypothetical protein A2Y90_00820 [Chloroflexi bacterium RBG_13_52_12]
MKHSLLKWELIGIAVISLLGSALHFTFEFAGGWPPVGVIAAVNESVFEHLKLTFWPTVLYAVITYKLLKPSTGNFIIGKAAALYVMPLAIIVLFYGYTTLTGIESVLIDILIFFVAVACGQLASYGILKMKPLPGWLNQLSLFLIIALALIYGIFTFYPPHVPFFMDSNTSTYGISQ